MDYQILFNFAGGFATTALGWFARELWTAVQGLKADLATLRAELPKEYVAKDDYKVDIGRVHELLDKIYDKLEAKADR